MYQSLFKVLNYKFEDISLLELALSHKSLGSKDNNERLEFLGDAILGAVIAEELFLKFPDITEGQMTRIRASLVKGSTLREKSKLLQLPKYVKASKAAKNLKNLTYPLGAFNSESLGPASLGAVPFHSQTYPFTFPEKSVVSAHFPFFPLRIRKLCPDAADG